jgi:LacI family transcriptional regulator
MATIKDIAKLVGVSVSTVSYALNDDAKVSRATRDKILEAARQLNYQKNGLASDLKRSRTQTIALIVTDLAGPYYAELVKGIQDVSIANGYDLIACSTHGGANSTAVKFLTEKRVDGAIVLAHNISEEIIAGNARKEFPIILLDRQVESPFVVNLEVDNEEGAYMATSHLIALGHRNIAYISGGKESRLHELRFQGFLRALTEHGLHYQNRYNIKSLFTREAGYNTVKMLIALGNLPTAMVFANDEMAIGGLQAFQENGIRVPDDISVVGFDDIELAQYVTPALTTVRQPKYDRGAMAAHLLLQCMDGQDVQKYYNLPTELIVRRSTAAPRM